MGRSRAFVDVGPCTEATGTYAVAYSERSIIYHGDGHLVGIGIIKFLTIVDKYCDVLIAKTTDLHPVWRLEIIATRRATVCSSKGLWYYITGLTSSHHPSDAS